MFARDTLPRHMAVGDKFILHLRILQRDNCADSWDRDMFQLVEVDPMKQSVSGEHVSHEHFQLVGDMSPTWRTSPTFCLLETFWANIRHFVSQCKFPLTVHFVSHAVLTRPDQTYVATEDLL